MQLSKRLQAVADLVTPGNRVADVGCDHAYTSIYLVENKLTKRVIAMDVNQGPIDRAKDNIEKYGYANDIETRRSNGLQMLKEQEADTILIAGMGGALMLQILEEKLELVSEMKELILQPQSEINRVRSRLQELDFLIVKENMVKDDGKYYMMLKAVPRAVVKEPEQFELIRTEHFYYGRLLLEVEHPVLKEFLLWDHGLCMSILDNLRITQTENAKLRESEMEEKIALIKGGLNYYKRVKEL
jgi:tRNA (adenine22-N1)-methyltransferase